MSYSLDEIHRNILPIVTEVNEQLRRAFGNEVVIELKGDQKLSTSIVTKIDRDTDSFLRANLSKFYPDFGFITEELEEIPSKNGYRWIIDPIDGTGNFAHKIPIFGVSIALWKDDEPLYGIISLPMLDEMTYGITGKGAFLNNKKIAKLSSQTGKHLYTVYNYVGSVEEKLRVLRAISDISPFISDFHCASFQFAMLVRGSIDCYTAINLSLWDIAAGIVMAREVGLHIEFLSPKPSITKGDYYGYKHSLVVANKDLALKVAERIRHLKQ